MLHESYSKHNLQDVNSHTTFRLPMHKDNITIADILGPWVDPQLDSGLIERCKRAWNKPLHDLTNEELATFLRQRFASEHILPIANSRLENHVDDASEIYSGELKAAVEYVMRSI
jgi:hypothetical protein